MEKINIAELLKDCPKGMELDCTIYEDCEFLDVDSKSNGLIRIITPNGIKHLDKYGCYNSGDKAKCVIFPKGKTTWEGFVPPVKFKDGDVLYVNADSNWIFIYKKNKDTEYLYKYAAIRAYINPSDISYISICDSAPLCYKGDVSEIRLATEEEKERFFQAIKDNGYKWNAETKTLEKLVEPKFKVGDRIKSKELILPENTITKVCEDYYELDDGCTLKLDCQDCWELIPDKFDITTLKPFESKVLVRDSNGEKWKPNFWGFYDSDNVMNYPYECYGTSFAQCIPYEENQHLLGTTNDCDEYYKTWEE